MTRSVEIPEAAVEAAYDALTGDLDKAVMRRALESALPYLAPAEQACSCPPHPNPEYSTPGDWDPNCPVHQPAGDGGLREALEEAMLELRGVRLALDLALAAHPAAPAVPQPADEKP